MVDFAPSRFLAKLHLREAWNIIVARGSLVLRPSQLLNSNNPGIRFCMSH
jgi:hypothetical protein